MIEKKTYHCPTCEVSEVRAVFSRNCWVCGKFMKPGGVYGPAQKYDDTWDTHYSELDETFRDRLRPEPVQERSRRRWTRRARRVYPDD